MFLFRLLPLRRARRRDFLIIALCLAVSCTAGLGIEFYLHPLKTDTPGPAAWQTGFSMERGVSFRPMTVGETAPDFTLPTLSDQETVHLADFRAKKPVVLVLSSFGCDLFCREVPRINALYRDYGDRAAFFFVYISEGPHQILEPPPEGSAPESKFTHIQRGMRQFDIAMPCLLDGEDKAVEKAYSGFPRRLVVVDRDGRIALDAAKGMPLSPWALHSVEAWLKSNLPESAAVRERTTALAVES